jgi:hypothetical protein
MAIAIPTFRSLAARRQERKRLKERPLGVLAASENWSSEDSLPPPPPYTLGVDIQLATKARRNTILLACLFFLISVVFLILVRPLPSPLVSIRSHN